jgi:hypothetical protein
MFGRGDCLLILDTLLHVAQNTAPSASIPTLTKVNSLSVHYFDFEVIRQGKFGRWTSALMLENPSLGKWP